MNNPEPEPGSETFSLQVRVYYEDTDFGGVVYYANYLKFMERARTEYLRALGFNQSILLAQDRVQFVVKSADINFVSPARFDDVLSVSCEVKKTRRASMQFTQQCRVISSGSVAGQKGSDVSRSNNSGATGGDLVASADVVIACLDADSFTLCFAWVNEKPGTLNSGSLKMV